jgi:tetratricopeptide (TPR) repeat protein
VNVKNHKPGIARRRTLAAVLVAGMAGAPLGAVQAQAPAASGTAQADPAVARAKQLLEQKSYKQAYASLVALEPARAGEPEFDYWLGVAAYESDHLERAAMAFERALTVNPEFDSARMELARTLFRMGSLDLAEQEFKRLAARAPNAQGQAAIDQYLAEIVRLKARQKISYGGYVELTGGRDSNITSSTRDFSQAVFSAFGFPGIAPTGNSIRRSASFLGLNTGIDALNRYREDRTLFASASARVRGYRNASDYNFGLFDATVGHEFRVADVTYQMTAFGQQFKQDGARADATNPVAATNDRRSGGLGVEVRKRISGYLQLASGVQLAAFRYKDNTTQDTDQATASVTALINPADWPGGSYTVAGFFSSDRAKRPLNILGGTDVSRKTAGLRFGVQSDPETTFSWFASVGWTRRSDDKAFARALLISKGRDDMSDVTIRASWRVARGISLMPYVTYLDNHSNIALYSFRKAEGGITVRYDFN